MKTWQKVVSVVVVVLIGLVGFIATRPDQFSLSRSTEIAAPPEKVYALVADFHEWPKWSPWEKKDLAMKKMYSGRHSGVGQIYEWQGNKDVGKGRMTVTEIEPGKLVRIKLEFLEPYPANNDTLFEFAAHGDKTTATWTMTGISNSFAHKALSLMMDSMVGPDFESGLASMKLAAEAK